MRLIGRPIALRIESASRRFGLFSDVVQKLGGQTGPQVMPAAQELTVIHGVRCLEATHHGKEDTRRFSPCAIWFFAESSGMYLMRSDVLGLGGQRR